MPSPASFPAVERIVGEDFFRAMARGLCAGRAADVAGAPRLRRPPSPISSPASPRRRPSPTCPTWRGSRRRWREAYHAARRRTTVARGARRRVAEAELPGLTFTLHPSLRLVRSRWPALTVWRMNVSDVPTTPVDFSVAEDALIVRPGAEVEVRIVPPGGAAFVTALAAGENASVGGGDGAGG